MQDLLWFLVELVLEICIDSIGRRPADQVYRATYGQPNSALRCALLVGGAAVVLAIGVFVLTRIYSR